MSDGDCAEVFNQTRISRSRKERKCYECSLPIPVGAPYIKTFMMFEGDADTFAVHVECDAIAEFVRDEICRVEHDNNQAHRRPEHRERFDGMIMMGGLGEEISSLDEYVWTLGADDAADARALGFTVEEDDGEPTATPAQVAEWIWDLAREPYRQPAPPIPQEGP